MVEECLGSKLNIKGWYFALDQAASDEQRVVVEGEVLINM